MNIVKNDWEVKPIPYQEAKSFVEEHHYAHGGANTAVATFGLFYKSDSTTLHGISWWMPPAYGAAKALCGENHRSVLALSRFCLVEERPENAGSFLISKSIKMLDKRWGMLLTYADEALHHNGGLYRASNWNYHGLTGRQPMYWDNEKHCMVSRKKGPKSFSKTEMLEMGYEFKGRFQKHRFIYPVKRSGLIVQSVSESPLLFTKEGKILKNAD